VEGTCWRVPSLNFACWVAFCSALIVRLPKGGLSWNKSSHQVKHFYSALLDEGFCVPEHQWEVVIIRFFLGHHLEKTSTLWSFLFVYYTVVKLRILSGSATNLLLDVARSIRSLVTEIKFSFFLGFPKKKLNVIVCPIGLFDRAPRRRHTRLSQCPYDPNMLRETMG
jgi:hypothetical protein